MTQWRFGEFAEDGEAWLNDSRQLHAYLDYLSPQRGHWRRLMIVTKSWLDAHLNHVRLAGDEPQWSVIPTMLVLPDANGEELRRLVDVVVQQGGLDEYSTPLVTR